MMRAFAGPGFLALALLASHVAFDSWFSGLRGKTYDLYQALLPAPGFSTPVVMVAIDEESLARHGRWPWSRGTLALLVDAVAGGGATAIGIDILLPEPDTGEGGAEDDARLARAIAAAPVILPASFGDVPTTAGAAPRAGWALVGDIPDDLPAVSGILASLPAFNEAARGLGIIRATPDPDGVLRELPMVWIEALPEGMRLWPSFALELARVHQSLDGYAARMSAGGFDALKLGERVIPLSRSGSLVLRERRESLPVISAAGLLDGETDGRLKGAIAIVTVTAVGLDAYHTTPARVARHGAEIHALVLEQILAADFPAEPVHARTAERAWFAAGALLILLFGARIVARPALAAPAIAILVASPFLAGLSAFVAGSLLIEGLQPAAGLLVVALFSGYSHYRLAERRRRRLQDQFSRFLSPEIVARLAGGDAEALVAVEKREITVLFVDLRGFTGMTASLGAGEIVAIVNHFLTIATDEILARNGTIDKFMGDAVLALWNAPIATDGHADRALEAAEAVIARIAAGNPALAARGLPPLQAGAGLETGICSVGNFGSARRVDYTAIGEAVNLAARLEAATRTAGVDLLAGPGLAARTRRKLVPAGAFRLQGFENPVEAYTLSRPLPAR